MKGKIGIGKVALYGREYLVAVKPHEKGLVMYTLHHAAEIRGMEGIEELATIPAKVKPQEVQLAKQIIGTFEKKLDLARLPRRVPRGTAENHRRQDCRRGDRRAGSRDAAQGRQPDGGAAGRASTRSARTSRSR